MTNLEWLGVRTGAELRDIRRTERDWGVKLPPGLATLMQEHAGAGIEGGRFIPLTGGQRGEFSSLLSSDEVTSLGRAAADQLPPQVFPFAGDDCGNYFCLDYRARPDPRILFWDHELGKIWDVAPDFDSFWKLVLESPRADVD